MRLKLRSADRRSTMRIVGPETTPLANSRKQADGGGFHQAPERLFESDSRAVTDEGRVAWLENLQRAPE